MANAEFLFVSSDVFRKHRNAALPYYRLQSSFHCYAFGSNRSGLSQHPEIGILGGFSNGRRLLFIVRKQVFRGMCCCMVYRMSVINGCVAILTQWLTIDVYVSRLHAAKSHAFHIILSTHISVWVRVGWAVMGCLRWVFLFC